MGQEVTTSHFHQADFKRFETRLQQETDHLHKLIETDAFSRHEPVAGLELEAWLVDHEGNPVADNEAFLQRLNNPDVVTELAKFNIELNVPPQNIAGDGLQKIEQALSDSWQQCQHTAQTMGIEVVSIGILPTLKDDQLCLSNMSARERYRALNEQVLRQRQGHAIHLDIASPYSQTAAADLPTHLKSQHKDVMLEAGTTSFQAHLQVTPENAARYYNASILASAVTVAVAANSPYLFHHALWDETRIPLFEQAIDIGALEANYRGTFPRVSFGSGYSGFLLSECFRENIDLFPVMLPLDLGEQPEKMPHLRLHNGTIWRWNRPLIGFDNNQTPHLRIEHRVMAAGPTIADMMANLAFYYGLVAYLAHQDTPPELNTNFQTAKNNFYAASQRGLDADISWENQTQNVASLITDKLIHQVKAGLKLLNVSAELSEKYLSLINARASSKQTGASWQREFIRQHGADFALLTREYILRQKSSAPVHTWDFTLHE